MSSIAVVANSEHPDGVVYARADCAGIARRLLAGMIDLGVVVAFAVAWWVACWIAIPDPSVAGWLWLGVTGIASGAYLATLKRTDLCTAGYRLAGIKVIALDGSRPGHWKMIFRFLLGSVWLLSGSMLFLLDFVWIGGDEQRQSLRDKLAGTLVVRRNAQPVGRGKQVVRLYSLIGWALYLREVKPQ